MHTPKRPRALLSHLADWLVEVAAWLRELAAEDRPGVPVAAAEHVPGEVPGEPDHPGAASATPGGGALHGRFHDRVPSKGRGRGRPVKRPPTGPAWDELVPAALELVSSEPDGRWTRNELSRAVRARGVESPTWTGVHIGLVAKLTAIGALVDNGDGTFSPPTLDQEPVGAAGRPFAGVSGDLEPSVSPRAPKPEPEPKPAWENLVAAGLELLRAEPGRRWTRGELCRVLRERGVQSSTWKGVHIGLAAKLTAIGALVDNKDGTLSAVGRGPGGGASPSGPSPATSGSVNERAAPRSEADRPVKPPQRATDEGLDAMVAEVEQLSGYLDQYSPQMVHAQICVWAGKARRLLETAEDSGELAGATIRSQVAELRRKLLDLQRSRRTEWVDALSREFDADWDTYVAYYQAVVLDQEPRLPLDQQARLHRALLKGLFDPDRHTRAGSAHRCLLAALTVLTRDDPAVVEVATRFGWPPEERPRPAQPGTNLRGEDARQPMLPGLDPGALGAARGRRVLIVGGPLASEANRTAIQRTLGLTSLEWVTAEGGETLPQRLEEAVRPGRYDLVLLLSSHASGGFLQACRDAAIPVAYLNREDSVTRLVQVIRQQLGPCPRTPEPENDGQAS